MKLSNVLSKVYGSSASIIVSTIGLACIVCKWPLFPTIIAILTSVVISSPYSISVHFVFLLLQKIRLSKSFVWMLLLASIPVSSFIVGWLFADFVPGKVWALLLLGIFSGYAGLFINAIAVNQTFNSSLYESEY